MHTQICDVVDRVVLVDAHVQGKPKVDARSSVVTLVGTVTVVTRATGKRVSAPISRGVEVDNCGGTSGGHAGCSESGGITIESRVLGESFLALRPREAQLVGKTGEVACREPDMGPPFVLCATRSWFVTVHEARTIRVFPFDRDALLASDPILFVTRERYAGKHATFMFGERETIAFDGVREACF
ncbi:MAG: hypothetical protein NT062_28860 [Proteobacteria bacterium]|nr:hypothetical protein [Pseudomonadota bacterium]